MKSLEFGAWQPVKSLDYKFSFAFICQVFSPMMRLMMFLLNRHSLTRFYFQLQSCQYLITYNPVFIDPAWLWTISRQYIFGLRHWNHALINHWVYYSNSQTWLDFYYDYQ